MISRVAENCFWLHRYVERAESTARLVAVNRVLLLDAEIHEAEPYKPLVLALGEQERFEQLVGVRGYARDLAAEEYLVWSTDNPVSIFSSLAMARENARMTREVISGEMWETLNTTWQWLCGPQARKEYKRDRLLFADSIRAACTRFQGDCHSTMLHEEPFDFMRLGMLLERAGQTLCVLEMKNHWRTPGPRLSWETPMESAQWMALLRFCSAVEPFFKRHSAAPTGPLVVRFLLAELAFPRAVLHCIDRARNFLERIDEQTGRRAASQSLRSARALVSRLSNLDVSELSQANLHAELRTQRAVILALSDELYADYFDPSGR